MREPKELSLRINVTTPFPFFPFSFGVLQTPGGFLSILSSCVKSLNRSRCLWTDYPYQSFASSIASERWASNCLFVIMQPSVLSAGLIPSWYIHMRACLRAIAKSCIFFSLRVSFVRCIIP